MKRVSLLLIILLYVFVANLQAVPVQWTIEDGGNDHYYEYLYDFNNLKTWTQAKMLAEQAQYLNMHGHLATITSAEENNFIKQIINNSGNGPAHPWIGGYQPDGSPEPDGDWRWITGEAWEYTDWGYPAPNNKDGEEDVLAMWWDFGLSWNDWHDANFSLSRGYVVEYELPCEVEMVLIAGGEFEMGRHIGEGDPGEDELPIHTVYVDSFYLGRYEVTNQQYCDFLNATDVKVVGDVVYASSDVNNDYPYCDTHSNEPISQINYVSGVFSVSTKNGRDMTNDPMVQVSWYGAVAYCDFYGYRLPSEAEWEYAARGAEYNPYYRFPWGDTISHTQANYYSDSAFSYDISPTSGYHPAYNDGVRPYTSPVSTFLANDYGLYDMIGNVWEWCNDWYDSGYYTISPYNNPTGPAIGDERILRGSAFNSYPPKCRVARRNWGPSGNRYQSAGFRVASSYDPVKGIVDFIEDSVEEGIIAPVKDGNPGQGQLNALISMLWTANDLIDAELITDACGQLHAALAKTDGLGPPESAPDFVVGPAKQELAGVIGALMADLGCQ